MTTVEDVKKFVEYWRTEIALKRDIDVEKILHYMETTCIENWENKVQRNSIVEELEQELDSAERYLAEAQEKIDNTDYILEKALKFVKNKIMDYGYLDTNKAFELKYILEG